MNMGMKKISFENKAIWKMHAYHIYEMAVMDSETGRGTRIILLALIKKGGLHAWDLYRLV